MLNKDKRKGIPYKKIWLAAISLIASVCAISYILFQAGEAAGDRKIALVNGDAVYEEEFRERLLMQQIPVQQYFKEKYQANMEEDFWHNSYGGEKPLKKAKEMALEEYVRIKVEQQLARDKGIVEDISYSAFLKGLEQENKRRKKAVENNEVIYGPIEYQKNVYYEYLRSNMEIKLKELLEGKEIQFTDEDLRRFYEQSKERLYAKEGRVKVLKISVSYTDGEGKVLEEKREGAGQKLEAVRLKASQGETVEDMPEVKNGGQSLKVNCKEQVFDETTAKQDAQLYSELKSRARELAPGKISQTYEENGSFYFLKGLEKEADGYKSFEEAKENVKVKYIDEKYEELIDGLVKKAKVDIDQDLYEQIELN